jgi:hypothetical protein
MKIAGFPATFMDGLADGIQQLRFHVQFNETATVKKYKWNSNT